MEIAAGWMKQWDQDEISDEVMADRVGALVAGRAGRTERLSRVRVRPEGAPQRRVAVEVRAREAGGADRALSLIAHRVCAIGAADLRV